MLFYYNYDTLGKPIGNLLPANRLIRSTRLFSPLPFTIYLPDHHRRPAPSSNIQILVGPAARLPLEIKQEFQFYKSDIAWFRPIVEIFKKKIS